MEICVQCPMCGCYFSISGDWKTVKINEMGDIYWQSHLRTSGTEHRCTKVLVPSISAKNP